MDLNEAARRLGVADTEIVDVQAHAGWWHVLHHDMASHEETWRDVPRGADEVGPEVVPDDADPDGPGVDVDGDGVPEGSARQIMDWVAGDPVRAAAALTVEQHRDAPRSTLIVALEKVTG